VSSDEQRGGAREPGCIFCDDLSDRAVWQSDLSVAIRDAFPVTEGHTLVPPRRHVATYHPQPADGAADKRACYQTLPTSAAGVAECHP